MSNNIVPSLSLEVQNIEGSLLVDSRLISNRLGIEHATLLKTIEKYYERLTSQNPARFEIDVVKRPQGGTYNERYFLLDERQCTLLMTYSRNTEQVLDCKDALVDAFSKAKELINTVIPAQNDRLRELETELAIQLAINQRMAVQDTRIALHGLATTLLLEGKADAIVEIDRPTIEVIDERSGAKFSGQTTKQLADYLNKNGGRNFKSGKELERELEKLGRGDLIDTVPRKTLQPFVSKENLQEACKVLINNRQQQLLGN